MENLSNLLEQRGLLSRLEARSHKMAPSAATVAAAEADDSTLMMERLVTKETVYMSASLKRVGTKYQSFIAAVRQRDAAVPEDRDAASAGVKAAHEAAVRELRVYALDVSKLGRIQTVLGQETDDCANQQSKIEAEIASAEKEIEELRAELAREKLLRQHKEEYEALARVINKYAPVAQSTSEIDELTTQSVEVEADAECVAEQVKTRKRQFALLMHTIYDLQTMLQEESESEEPQLSSTKRKRGEGS